jgi:hypothetical protein
MVIRHSSPAHVAIVFVLLVRTGICGSATDNSAPSHGMDVPGELCAFDSLGDEY